MKPFASYAAATMFIAAGLASAVLPARAGEMAYIPLGSDNKLALVDVGTDKVVGTIEGLPAVHGLAGTPDGRLLIAGSYKGRERDSTAPAKPSGVAADEHAAHHATSASPLGSKSSEISTLTIIKTADRSVTRRIDVPGAVHHVAVSSDGRLAVVTHPSEDSISAIDLTSYEVVANLSTGPLPNYAAFSPDGKSVYVSNAGNGTVSTVDVERWIVSWNTPVGATPEHVVLSDDGKTLYVNNVDDGTVSVIDTAERKVARTIPIGKTLHGIDLSDDGKTLFVVALGDEQLTAVDLATGKSREISLKPAPYHLAAIRRSSKLYVSSADKPKLWVLDQKSLKVTGEIPIGGKGHQLVHVVGGS